MVSANETLTSELSLDVDWSLGEKSFAEIKNLLKELDPKRILEFGSGVSSIRLALSFPDCELISVEHNRFYADKTEAMKNAHNASNLELLYAPLKHRWLNLGRYLTYSFNVPNVEFDSLIIDGPPGFVRGGREACLFLAYENLKIGGYVFLDDYERKTEQHAVQSWLEAYPGSFEWFIIESGHRIAVLRKIRQVNPNLFTIRRMSRNFRYNLRNFISRVKGLI